MKKENYKKIVTIKDTNLSCLSFSFLAIPAAFCFSRYSAYRSRLRTISTGWIIKLRNTCSACIVAALLFAVSPPPPPWHWHKSLGSVFLIYHLRLHHHSQFLSHLVLLNSPAKKIGKIGLKAWALCIIRSGWFKGKKDPTCKIASLILLCSSVCSSCFFGV